MNPSPLLPPRELLEKLRLRPNKGLGQNFLTNTFPLEYCLDRLAIQPGDRVIEIGPGLGHFTRLILARGAQITVVERDRTLLPHLTSYFGDTIKVVVGDCMAADFLETLALDPPRYILGNLPYHVGTALVEKLLRRSAGEQTLGFMLQREVAVKFVAEEGNGDYGYLSLLGQSLSKPHILWDFPAEDFFPPPKVASSFIMFRVENRLPIGVKADPFLEFCRRLFTSPRRQIQSRFKPIAQPFQAFLEGQNRPATVRAGELSVGEIHSLYQLCQSHGFAL